jgi:hypothetical protein
LNWKHRARLLLIPIVMLSLFAASGCAVHRVRADFTGFEKAFADTSNRELLLNLARLQNHDPTYFFKMGQITSSYRMAASLSTNGSYVIQGTTPGGGNATGGGSPGLTYENDPLFQFIPVNDETNAQLLLKSIPPETFYILYQQGWRIDQLFRLMVDRIEVTHSTPTGCGVVIYRNVAPAVRGSGPGATVLDEDELSSYASFLRASAIAYGLQKHGFLVLRGITAFLPLDAEAEPLAPGQSASPGAVVPSRSANDTHANGISASDIEKAAEKSFTYETDPTGKVLIGQRIVSSKFYLIPPKSPMAKYEPDTDTIAAALPKYPHLAALGTGSALRHFLAAVQNGFTIEGDVAAPDAGGGPCPGGTESYSAHLVLRSLIGVMAAAAQEQAPFDKIVESNPLIEKQPGDQMAQHFNDAIPDIERLLILRINWKNADGRKLASPTQPLMELNYRGTDYLIADAREPAVEEDEYWNRDVFRLIGALTAQVTVDISRYPIPDILQLHPD